MINDHIPLLAIGQLDPLTRLSGKTRLTYQALADGTRFYLSPLIRELAAGSRADGPRVKLQH